MEEEFLVWRHLQHLRRKLPRQHPFHPSRRKSSSLQGKMVVRRVEDLSATAPSSQSSCSLYQGEASTPASRRGSKGSSTCSTPARTCSARPVDSDTAGETLVSSLKILTFMCIREEMSQYTAHLDWHFRVKRREKDNARKAQSR